MKVLLLPMGSYGDIHPYLGLGLQMKKRGHDVYAAGNRYFEGLFKSQGIDFCALKSSSDYTRFYSKPDHGKPISALIASGKWCTLEPMREVYSFIAQHYKHGGTVAVAPYYSFGARIAGENLGIPLATLVLLPYELRSIFKSPVLPKPLFLCDWIPRILKRFQFWVMDRFVVDRILGPETNRFRKELGLPEIKRFLNGWCFSNDRVIGLFPNWYAPAQPDWPQNILLSDFPRWDPCNRLESSREAIDFAVSGDPPIVFTTGSYIHYGKRFFSAAVECCNTLGKRGILLTRHRQLLPAKFSKSIAHFEYVPLASLLPHSSALVSHGGIGTIAQALASGVPQLLMPIAYNHPDDAIRLKRMGVADFIPPSRFTGHLLACKLRKLMGSINVSDECSTLAKRFQGFDAIKYACELLEELQDNTHKEMD